MSATVMPVMLWSLVLLGGALGLAVGSFLNVVAYRLPIGGSLVSPPSACPGCGSGIRPYDNIPVLSWLVLRGRCRDCREPISWRYPVIEAATGVLFVVVAVAFLPEFSTRAPLPAAITLIAFLYLAAISVALAVIDIDTHTLPNRIVLPAYAIGGALLGTALILEGEWSRLVSAAVGCAAAFLFYLVLALARPGGMGFGDVKLAGVLGLYLGSLGWAQLAIGVFAAFVLGGVFGIALTVTRRATRTSGIPFGPWMLAGAWLGILAGGPLWAGYLRLIGLG
ncbi:prepilin peptidase [Leifsonia naganoensis]|uniref:Prepilin leader peptidase/N-methyltransferase n=1 Tax=Leifsonia naganoensis TaxID=150025 RepID=A0A853DTF7_9MICO|nr:A24 family peptidase [Leifsonia naganoensis]NYK10749.1 leader peptidase (prepilin peptidase)/N-methyltransferase [Leifsonia naganoensis]